MANTWPKERRLLGTRIQRLDGPEKSTGRAKYSFDINRPSMLHALILRCPHAHARLIALDTTEAEKLPGVKAIHVIVPWTTPGPELFYAGDEILGLAADTEEHAHDALRAVKAKFEVLDHFVTEEDALKATTALTVSGKRDDKTGAALETNIKPGGEGTIGDPDSAFRAADVVVEGDYGCPTISHQCLESHGLVAEWDPDGKLTVWASTQAVAGTAGELAKYFNIAATKCKCITHYMGGGFGSKFGPDIQGIVAAELAKKAKAPVKLMLDRAEEITTAGNRPSAFGRVKIGGTKDGKLTAYEIDCIGSPGVGFGGTVNFTALPYVYPIPNVRRKHTVIRLNAGSARAMRAPGHPQNCVLTEGAIDDFAAQIGMDPLQVRLKNLPESETRVVETARSQGKLKDLPDDNAEVVAAIAAAKQSFNFLRNTIYQDEIKTAARLAEWDKKWHPPGADKGVVKRGIGMAMHTWGGGGYPSHDVTITVNSDGSVRLESSTQDLGTGERTVLAIITAEALGLQPGDIDIRIGESPFGRSGGSGGSTTCPGTAPAVLNAACAARDALFEKLAPKLNAKKEDLAIAAGKIVDKANNKNYSWKEACARLGRDVIQGKGDWTKGLSNVNVGGVQIAEVKVDTETGVVKCTRVVAVQDCGLVVNLRGCESQVSGGVIMGVNYALFEERIMDRITGRQVNPDMEFYKLAGIQDIPQIIVHMHDMPERGVIGIGEPPTISTCAAIGNAVFNAIGVRVPFAPYTPERVLERLAKRPTSIRVTSRSSESPEEALKALVAKNGGIRI
ncbi:MAG: xanthine dehydrogenase family protein molybdopterin-binding subunit [Gemmataceae bacterium]